MLLTKHKSRKDLSRLERRALFLAHKAVCDALYERIPWTNPEMRHLDGELVIGLSYAPNCMLLIGYLTRMFGWSMVEIVGDEFGNTTYTDEDDPTVCGDDANVLVRAVLARCQERWESLASINEEAREDCLGMTRAMHQRIAACSPAST